MRRLVRTALEREISFGGREYRIPPPTVRTACEIIATARGAAAGEMADNRVFCEAVRRWLPLRLASGLLSRRLARARAASLVLAWVLEGSPATARKKDQILSEDGTSITGDPLEALADLDVEELLADYAGAYACDPAEVYAGTPFPAFLLFYHLSDRVRARAGYDYLATKSIPFIEDEAERSDAMRRLTDRAGLTRPEAELTREQKIERSRRNLEILSTFFNTPGHA